MATIEANELRIGNLVFDHLGRVQTVAETRADAYICYLTNGAKLKYKLNTTKPIPLSEEWWLKFGFEELYDDGEFYKDGFHYMDKKLYFYTSSIPIEYVHGLQNLYFALTGDELQLK